MTANSSICINRSRLAFSECAGGPSSRGQWRGSVVGRFHIHFFMLRMGVGLSSSQPSSPFSHDMLCNCHLKLEGKQLALGAASKRRRQVRGSESIKYKSSCNLPPHNNISFVRMLNSSTLSDWCTSKGSGYYSRVTLARHDRLLVPVQEGVASRCLPVNSWAVQQHPSAPQPGVCLCVCACMCVCVCVCVCVHECVYVRTYVRGRCRENV